MAAMAAPPDVTGLLRPGLLDGVGMLVAEASPGSTQTLGGVVAASCAELGARVDRCAAHVTDEIAMDEAVTAVAGGATGEAGVGGDATNEAGGVDMLVVDGAALFAEGAVGDGEAASTSGHTAWGHTALRACLDASWNVTRAVINHAFLPEERGGRVVYLAPAPDAGEFAEAARAGLENLARTLSIEWARHGVNVLCIAPGANTGADEVAALCAYLASPAGAYFSGCLLDLRGP